MSIFTALLGHAAARFDNCPQFIDKGFEIVIILYDVQAPTGELALINSFSLLIDLEMGHDEALKTYTSRIRRATNLLRGGNVQLHPILINLFAVKGIVSASEAVKHNLSLHSKNFTSLTLDELERKCLTFTNAARNVQSAAAIHTAAATEAADTSTRSCVPGTSTTPSNPKATYPPSRLPSYKMVK